MTFNKQIFLGLLLALVTLGMNVFPAQAATQTVPLSVLKDGTNNTSYAASYFANTATVTSAGNGSYTITSTITTAKALGNYPVQMLSINGAPAAVSKTDAGDSQVITYSFQTNQLAARHEAVIKVDVDSLNYHHTYNVGLQVDASAVSNEADETATQATEEKTTTNAKPDMTKYNDMKVTDTEQADVSADEKKAAQTSSAATKEKRTSDKAMSDKTNNAKRTSRPQNQPKSHDLFFKKLMAIIVGGLGVGVLAAVGMIWFVSRKK